MCFYKEGPARVVPSMQKGFPWALGRAGPQRPLPRPCLRRNLIVSWFFDSDLLPSSP